MSEPSESSRIDVGDLRRRLDLVMLRDRRRLGRRPPNDADCDENGSRWLTGGGIIHLRSRCRTVIGLAS